MIRSLTICMAFLLLTLPVSALSTTLEATYTPEETMIARVEGALVSPINPRQVELRRNHVLVPLEFDVGQLDASTYFWGIAPRTVGNYTLVFKDVQTMNAGILESSTFMQNFSVSGEIVPYAIRPGFAYRESDLTFRITSYVDSAQTISVSHPSSQSIILSPGENEFSMPISSISGNTLMAVSIGKYRVPVFIRSNATVPIAGNTNVWAVEPSRIKGTIERSGKLPSYLVTATYKGNRDLKNIILTYNKSIFTIVPDTFKKIAVNESLTFNVSVKERVNSSRTEQISFGSGNESYVLLVALETQIIINNTNQTGANGTESLPYCSQLSGIVCRGADQCSKAPVASREGLCCLATCEQPTPASKAWIGYLLFGIILLVGIIIWSKYKKVRPVDTMHLPSRTLKEHP